MAQLVVGVESTGEHCSALAKEHSVVDPQGKSKAGRREGNCCGHQLHRLASIAKSSTSTVAAGQPVWNFPRQTGARKVLDLRKWSRMSGVFLIVLVPRPRL